MHYYSTNHHTNKVSFREAMLRSEAADGGLYMPEKLPILPKAVINNMPWMSLKDIAFVVNNTLFGEDMSSSKLKQIGDEVCSYNMPLYEIEEGIYVMELFHGPTKTVKDFGAQTLVRIIRHLLKDSHLTLNVMVPTTGNSGNAIASGFYDMDGVNVFVLYPQGLAKNHIEHINSLGENIHSMEVKGTIDDCVSMIHKAYNDKELNENMMITSANSMNLGSLLPSTIPYFHAFAQLKNKNPKAENIYFSVPTGNGGNLLAGYIAQKMGLPVAHLIGACNENAGIHRYLTTGVDNRSIKSHTTLAYGMDRTYSANVPRFMDICKGDIETLRRDILSESITDNEIKRTINDVYRRTGYLLDPHGAVSYCALKRHLPKGACGVVMATSHPSKSLDILYQINDGGLKLPYKMKEKNFCSRPETAIPPTYGALKKYLRYYIDNDYLQSQFA